MATCHSTPLEQGAVAVAYNLQHTRLAVLDAGGRVSVWQRDGPARSWAVSGTWASDKLRLTVLAWAASEQGAVLAGGAADGAVCIWEETGEGGWALRARLVESSHSVQHMAFAPPQLGPLLAVAYADGFVRLFEASAPLAAASWELASELQASTQACTGLDWQQPSPGLPPLLVVGTAADGAQVWMYREQLMRWEQAATLGSPQVDYQGKPITSVAWAPTLGRPVELVAVAAGQRVLVWSLQGPADAMQAERLAVLEHSAPVWQVQWNLLGNWLAASTEGSEVCLWRPDLAGEWLLVNKIVGSGSGGAMQA